MTPQPARQPWARARAGVGAGALAQGSSGSGRGRRKHADLLEVSDIEEETTEEQAEAMDTD
eukprot:1149236-Pelagomonas_calceolata.AAC.1